MPDSFGDTPEIERAARCDSANRRMLDGPRDGHPAGDAATSKKMLPPAGPVQMSRARSSRDRQVPADSGRSPTEPARALTGGKRTLARAARGRDGKYLRPHVDISFFLRPS